MTQRTSLRLAGPHHFGKQHTFFLQVMVAVGKRPEKTQKCHRVILIDSFTSFSVYHGLKDIEGTENYYVVLLQKVCAIHADAPFASAGCRTGSEIVTSSIKVAFGKNFGSARIRLVR